MDLIPTLIIFVSMRQQMLNCKEGVDSIMEERYASLIQQQMVQGDTGIGVLHLLHLSLLHLFRVILVIAQVVITRWGFVWGGTMWPVDSLGGPTEVTTDLPGQAMWGG